MALICFVSQKGSPGTTASSLAVAASWPLVGARRKLLVEADSFGGVLALRYQLGIEPGLVTLAAAARGGVDGDEVWEHAQLLPGGLPAVVGPDRPDQASAVLSAAGAELGRYLAELNQVDVIVDLGRIGANSDVLELIARADLVLMVARPVVEQLQPAAQRLKSFDLATDRLGWVLIGDRPHDPIEVESAFGVRVAGVIANDPRGAAALENGASPGRLRRSALVRSASALARDLERRVAQVQTADPAETPRDSSSLAGLASMGRRGNGD